MIARVSAKALRYWHPVLPSSALGKKPVEIKLCGVEQVLYRTSSGQVAALDSRCPHRKMRLALGHVEEGRIVCPYHGWSFDPDGRGKSPATPAMKIQTGCYQVREQHGAIWLRSGEVASALPAVGLDFPGYFPLTLLHHHIDAPFQLLIDNMAELEHTGTVHSVFGFDSRKMHLIKTEVDVTDTDLNIFYSGPQRKLPAYLQIPTGILEGDHFVQYAKVRFGPVHAVYDLEWWTPDQKKQRPLQLKFVIFFNPTSDNTCEQFTFVFAKTANRMLERIIKTFKGLLVNNVDNELRADIQLVESLRLTPQQYEEYLPSRFDRPIREAAAMIDQLYFQHAAAPQMHTVALVERSA